MSGKYKQVAYYPGCALEGTGHAYNRSTKELGKALGLDVVELENWNCCGAMEVKNVDRKLQTYLSARNLSIAEAMGFESELLRDKDIIWQCVSCNKCTYACPRDVNPEGVMKATAHWLELKGHTEKKPSMIFDEAFSEQVFATGKIEDGRVLRQFFARTKQPLFQDWLIALVRGLVSRLPVGLMMKLGLATLFRPRTRGWDAASAAIEEYV